MRCTHKFGVVCLGFYSMFLSYVNLDVPVIYQYPKYPTGCESVATTEVLQHLGYKIGVDDFIDNYVATIPITDSKVAHSKDIFDRYFVGNPKSFEGISCNPGVMMASVDKYFSDVNSDRCSCHDLTGVNFRNLLDEVALGNPVIVWLTIDYKKPVKTYLYNNIYYTPSHTVVLSGYDVKSNKVRLTDSIKGNVDIDYNVAKSIYDNSSKRAFVIRRKG